MRKLQVYFPMGYSVSDFGEIISKKYELQNEQSTYHQNV